MTASEPEFDPKRLAEPIEVAMIALYAAYYDTIDTASMAAYALSAMVEWASLGSPVIAVCTVPTFRHGSFFVVDLAAMPHMRDYAVAIYDHGQQIPV